MMQFSDDLLCMWACKCVRVSF